MGQFGVGQAMRRIEDPRLLTGRGRYTDDIRLEGEAVGFVLRSPHAHAQIAAIDTAAAAAAPGVLGVYTAADLARDGIGDITCLTPMTGKGGSAMALPTHPVLARGRVRHVGDPVAFVVAETLEQAKDAAELIEVDYRDLPAVVDTGAALDPGAPRIWDEAPHNLCLHWDLGEEAATAAAFAGAAHVTRLELVNNRLVVNPMEPRNALGVYDEASGRFTLTTGSQGAHKLKPQLARDIFHVPAEQVRVVTPDVGGAFGMKNFLFAEQVLVLWAARALGRPVRWNGERGESFVSDSQGRDHVAAAELALDAEGRILGLRASIVANMGAYLSNFGPFIPTGCCLKMLSGLYRIPAVYAEVKCVFTNTVPVDAYRGAGRPEAAYIVERLIDAAARELGLDPIELRRRNFVRAAQMPYATATGLIYDSGDFPAMMERALERIDHAGLPARRAKAVAEGKLRGIGLACYIEECGGSGQEDARVRLDPDGEVTVYVGTQNNGQGHATAYTQIVADRLGLAPERIRIRQGDTDELAFGGGTGGSRSLLMGGGAIAAAADKAIERARRVAGHLLEAAEADLEFRDGAFAVVGTDRRVGLAEIAKATHAGAGLPEELRRPINEAARHQDALNTYPNGCHACEVEVDRATGLARIVRFVIVDDFGTLVNPLLAAGQVHGGTVQGIGQALLERTVYDPESGQLLTGSFMDYCMPRADDVPMIELTMVEDFPCATNPMGAKGAGEAGSIGASPAVINAIVDALGPLGVRHIDMPATPERVWRAIREAEARGAGA
ncbi:MAG: xanthine dehydrogenase family protein molybdopterin-binding subunit [Kiloniellaceae bacterium]